MGLITAMTNPFRWAVDAGTVEISVNFLFVESSRSKVNQLHSVSAEINQNVFVFNVSVYNTSSMDVDESSDNLMEEVSCKIFRKRTSISDVVEEVFDGIRTFHNNDEAISFFIVVKKSNNTLDVFHSLHQTDLDGYCTTIDLAPFVDFVLSDPFDGNRKV